MTPYDSAALARLEEKVENIKEDTKEIPRLCEKMARHDVRIENLEDKGRRTWNVTLAAIVAAFGLATRAAWLWFLKQFGY